MYILICIFVLSYTQTTKYQFPAFVDGKIDICGVLVAAGLAASRSEARRNVEQGGVTVDGEKVTDVKTAYEPGFFAGEGVVVKRGKKNFKKVTY